MTCLCSQIFMLALSFVLPVYFSSWASSFRADRLLSRSSSFIRSTMDLRQSSFCELLAASFVSTASTSTIEIGDEPGAWLTPPTPADCCCPAADAPLAAASAADRCCPPPADVAAPPAGTSAALADPKIADLIFPKMLIVSPLVKAAISNHWQNLYLRWYCTLVQLSLCQ